jgi:antitoxin component YwqK of YwqJK toxin-antitoxin module
MNYILILVAVVLAVGSIAFIYFLSSETEEEKKEMDIQKTLDSGEYGERLKKFFQDDVEHIHIDVLEKVLKELISNGNIDKTNHNKNNRKNGKWLCYDHENGKLLNEVNYNDNIVNGISKVYYENGYLSHKGNIKDGKMDGLWEFYKKNGEFREKANFEDGHIID